MMIGCMFHAYVCEQRRRTEIDSARTQQCDYKGRTRHPSQMSSKSQCQGFFPSLFVCFLFSVIVRFHFRVWLSRNNVCRTSCFQMAHLLTLEALALHWLFFTSITVNVPKYVAIQPYLQRPRNIWTRQNHLAKATITATIPKPRTTRKPNSDMPLHSVTEVFRFISMAVYLQFVRCGFMIMETTSVHRIVWMNIWKRILLPVTIICWIPRHRNQIPMYRLAYPIVSFGVVAASYSLCRIFVNIWPRHSESNLAAVNMIKHRSTPPNPKTKPNPIPCSSMINSLLWSIGCYNRAGLRPRLTQISSLNLHRCSILLVKSIHWNTWNRWSCPFCLSLCDRSSLWLFHSSKRRPRNIGNLTSAWERVKWVCCIACCISLR